MNSFKAGICYLQFYAVLKNKAARRIIQAMDETGGGVSYQDDPYVNYQVCRCDTFADMGVTITVSRHDSSPWGLYVTVSP